VTTLLEQLSQSNPDITAEEAAEFRACVLTIAQHNETDPKCIGFSLQDWEQWLENGGYGLNNFVAMLKQVCNAALGDAAVATLWDYTQSIATAPEGIPRLIEYVQTTYPGLEQRMTTLEALALEEEQRIQETAGGMSKKAGIVTGVVGGVVAGALLVGAAKWYRDKGMREAAELKERTDREAEKVYSDKTFELKHMITERGINAVENKNLDGHDMYSIKEDFVKRAKVFDFQAYAKRKIDQLGSGRFMEFQRGEADRLIHASEGVLTDQERAFAKMVKNPNDMYANHDLAVKPGFEKYAMDRYVLTNSERLLKMNDEDFVSFLENEGKSFVRGEGAMDRQFEHARGGHGFSEFIGDGKRDLERKTEDYFGNEVVSLEKSVMDDVEIDIDKSVVQATKELEVKVETKAEEAVVRETDRVEGAVEGWEASVDDII
jgi:hypothetical protein